jgi:uncharacterized protein YjbI with pentapeptide repeats
MAQMTKMQFLDYLLAGGQPRNMDLTGMDLSNEPELFFGKDWTNSIFDKTNCSGSNLSRGKFDNTLWRGAVLNETDLSKSSFLKSNLHGARGHGTNLNGSKMNDARLTFSLIEPKMEGVTAERSLFPRRRELGVQVTDLLLAPEYGQWRDPSRLTAIKKMPENVPEHDGVFTGASAKY